MNDDDWTEAEVGALHQQIRDELGYLFAHDEVASRALLADWLACNPGISPDTISHEGPFNVALRIHYALVEGGDPASHQFIEWRKQFHDLWIERSRPKLTPAQESLLRQRGWHGQ